MSASWPSSLALRADECGIISRVHEIGFPTHPVGAHPHERDGHLRIVHAGAGENTADGNAAAVGYIPMQFETAPVALVSLAAGLDAQAALLWQVGEHFLERHVLLAL